MVWRFERGTVGPIADGNAGRSGRSLRWSVLLLAATGMALAGCGSNASNRVGGATAGGAATGATIGLLGGPIGVIVGGAIGGGVAALTAQGTTSKQVDLGNPPWDRGGSAASSQGSPAHSGSAQAHRQMAASGNTDSSGSGSSSGAGSSSGSGDATRSNDHAEKGQPQNLLDASGMSGSGSIKSTKLPPP